MYVQSFGAIGEDAFTVYTVASGDTLDKIAKRYGTTYQEIAKTNMLDDPNKIEVGQQLMIYTKEQPKKSIVPSITKIQAPILPKVSNSMVNYALIGGIVALSIPIAIKLFGRKQVA